jgi:hypothetical protein
VRKATYVATALAVVIGGLGWVVGHFVDAPPLLIPTSVLLLLGTIGFSCIAFTESSRVRRPRLLQALSIATVVWALTFIGFTAMSLSRYLVLAMTVVVLALFLPILLGQDWRNSRSSR